MKRIRRIEVIRYSRRVTVFEGAGCIDDADIAELPIIDVGHEQQGSAFRQQKSLATGRRTSLLTKKRRLGGAGACSGSH